jgi:transcription initiation factor TFIID subunit TAF12
VLWLDLTAAKARYGRWLGGTLPAFVPFQRTTRARTKAQKDASAAATASAASQQQQNGAQAAEADDRLLVRMRRLRCSSPPSCGSPGSSHAAHG